MHRKLGRIWITRERLEAMIAEADRTYPLETGGVFMGYWSGCGHDAVITEVVGPGPDAIHKAHGFIPDYPYQEERIADHYGASGRRHTYLGDWHTHPDTKQTRLSWQDRRTLGRIAFCPKARSPIPVMGVFAGTPDNWVATIWKGERRRIGNYFFGSRARPLALQLW